MQFDENAPVLEIKDLNLSYWTRAGEIPAVIDFSLTLDKGESIGLVGESGCGKSTVAMAIMQYMGGNGDGGFAATQPGLGRNDQRNAIHGAGLPAHGAVSVLRDIVTHPRLQFARRWIARSVVEGLR